MRIAGRLALAALLALSAAGRAQETEPSPAAEEAPAWDFNASVYGYFVPEERDYGQPTVTADHGAWHLEARYNYENFETGSAWVGWNFSFGDKLSVDATVMLGGVFGKTMGAAPGYHLTVSYGDFQLYSEGEYVLDARNAEDNYLYNWTQLGYSPFEWLQVGLVTQRTRAYHTDLDVQRGFFVSYTWKSWSLSVYVFNPDEQPTVASAVAFSF